MEPKNTTEVATASAAAGMDTTSTGATRRVRRGSGRSRSADGAAVSVEQLQGLHRQSSANARAQIQRLQKSDAFVQAELDAALAKIAAMEAASHARDLAAAREASLEAVQPINLIKSLITAPLKRRVGAAAQIQQPHGFDPFLQAELNAANAQITALEAANRARDQAAVREMSLEALQTFYHGTSLEAALTIQDGGFRVDLAGSNAGAMLGNGVYITTTLEKALNYAHGTRTKPRPHGGCVLQLKVDLGRMYTLKGGPRKPPDDPLRTRWFMRPHNYDSCFSPAGFGGEREEHCVRDANRVHVVSVTLAHTGKANEAGYFVRGNKLVLDMRVVREKEALRRKIRNRLAREKALRQKPVRKHEQLWEDAQSCCGMATMAAFGCAMLKTHIDLTW